MTIDTATVQKALDILGPGTKLELSYTDTGLLRYARSRVTAQHSEVRLRARVRITRNGRTAAGVLETLEPEAVADLSARLGEALETLPPGTTAPCRPAECDTPPPELGELGSHPGASERHQWFSTVRAGLGEDVLLGGAIRNDVVDRVVADSDGLYRAERLTTSAMQAVGERDGRTASVRAIHRDPAGIDVAGIADQLLPELAPLPWTDPVPDHCRVVLRPQAVITLLATYGYAALGAAGYARGHTAVAGKLGEQVVSELLTVTDDGTDPDGLPSAFDVEGSFRRRTPLIERGKLAGVVSNLTHADVTGGVSTGHGVPFGWRFGGDPAPSHLFLEPGEATEDELLAQCGDGLLVSRLDYLRVLHPKDTLVTGTTRDATYRVENGKVVARHPQVRFTFRMDEVLRAVLAVGRTRERGETTFMESVVAPALLIEADAMAH
jgi:predicted Zn-dependent protease